MADKPVPLTRRDVNRLAAIMANHAAALWAMVRSIPPEEDDWLLPEITSMAAVALLANAGQEIVPIVESYTQQHAS